MPSYPKVMWFHHTDTYWVRVAVNRAVVGVRACTATGERAVPPCKPNNKQRRVEHTDVPVLARYALYDWARLFCAVYLIDLPKEIQ